MARLARENGLVLFRRALSVLADKDTCRAYDIQGEMEVPIESEAVMILRIFLFLIALLQHA